MKKLTLLLILSSAGLSSTAQITFQKTFGGTTSDGAFSTQQTFDGGYIIAGKTMGVANVNQAYLIKTDEFGSITWAKTYGGLIEDYAYSVKQTSDSGFILAGTTGSFGVPFYDVYLVKTNLNGDTLWTRTFGDSAQDEATDVIQTSDNGYLICGYTNSFPVSNYTNAYILKTDSAGNLLWTQVLGGYLHDKLLSVKETPDGGYILVGATYNYGVTNDDIWLIRMNNSGTVLWTKTFGGTGYDDAYDVINTTDGGFALTGFLENACLLKLDSMGNLSWAKSYGGSGFDIGYSLKQTFDNGFVIAGTTTSFGFGNEDVYLIKTDSSGNLAWSKTYGGSNIEYGLSVNQTADSGFIIAGYTFSFGSGSLDLYLIKTDANGNSGCAEFNATSITTIPTVQIGSPIPIPVQGGIQRGTLTVSSNYSNDSTLCLTTTAVNQINKNQKEFSVYPNPNNGNFIVSISNKSLEESFLTIVDLFGNKLLQRKLNLGKTEINAHLPNGIYFMKVFDGVSYYCRKLIVEHD